MHRKGLIALLLFAACFLTPTSVVKSETPNTAKSLKVALVLGLSGHAAYHADAIRKGVELAAEELRSKGQPLDLRVEDDQTNPAKTVSAVQYLLSENYKFFIGPTWSFQANAARPIFAKANALALIPAGSSDINGGASSVMFNLCPARRQQTPVLADWLKARSYKAGYIIAPNGDWGEIHQKVFADALGQSQVVLVEQDTFDFGADFETLKVLLLRVKAKKADILLVTGAGADVANIIKARNELKMPLAVVGTNDLRDAAGMGLVSLKDLQPNVFALALGTSTGFNKRYHAKFNESPKLYSERGYDALMILAEAAAATDGSVESVRKYFQNQLSFDGASGKVEFTEEGDVRQGNYYIAEATSFIEEN